MGRRGDGDGPGDGRWGRGALLAVLLVASGCASTPAPGAPSPLEVPRHETLRATLWVQTAAEFPALFLQAYLRGVALLPEALDDREWTAAPVEQRSGFQDLPPAVVLDIDETVLDNSPYQARRIEAQGEFTTRRAYIASRYRILVVAGDDLNDFVPARISREERSALVERYRDHWGERWLILPNPIYGSWESAVTEWNPDLTPEERRRLQDRALDPARSGVRR